MKTTTIAVLVSASAIAIGLSPVHAQGKNPTGVDPTHYACYRVSEAKPFQAQTVKLNDQFGTSAARVVKAAFLCAPVEKNGQPVQDKTTHLVCYTVTGGKNAGKKVQVTNQFGQAVLAVGGTVQLCVPSLKKVL